MPSYLTGKQRDDLYKKQGRKCPYCGKSLGSRHKFRQQSSVEHVVPLSKGGNNRMINKLIVHRHCNKSKGNRYPNNKEIKALWGVTGIKTILGLFDTGPRIPYNIFQQNVLIK